MNRRKVTRKGSSQPQRISVRGVQRDEPDIRKLSKALIGLALAQAEADAQRELKVSKRAAPDAAKENRNGDEGKRVA